MTDESRDAFVPIRDGSGRVTGGMGVGAAGGGIGASLPMPPLKELPRPPAR